MTLSSVLVVEDNLITRKMLRLVLEGAGYGVLEAVDGRTALEMVARQRPDLVLQDLVLPDMDGLELLAAIRRASGRNELPAIVLTGVASQLDAFRARSGPRTDFLVKPVEPPRLLHILGAQLSAAVDSAGKGRLILVGDNEELNRKLMCLKLEQVGFRVETASGGKESLAKAHRSLPDAIVSDVLMRDMDGFLFCHEVRRSPALGRVPVVLISSTSIDEKDRELAHRLGASAFVLRTPDLREVTSAIAGALERPSPPPLANADDLATLREERIRILLDRQAARNESLLRQATIQTAALSLVRGLTEAFTSPRDVTRALGEVLVQCLEASGLSTGMLYLSKPTGFYLQAMAGVPAAEKAHAERCFGHPELLRRVLEAGEPVALLAGAEGLDPVAREFVDRLQHASALIVPFTILGQSFGALVLASDAHDLSDSTWVTFGSALAGQFAHALALGHSLFQLAATAEQHRILMEHANDAILVLGPGHGILHANRRAEELLGLPRPEIIGRNYNDFVPSEERGSADSERLLAQGSARVETRDLRRADGTRVPVEISSSVVRVNEESLVLAILRDVGEREQAEAKLRDSEEQYRFLFENNPQPMWVYDEETLDFLAVNEAAVQHYGYSRDEFLAMNLENIHPSEEIPALYDQAGQRAGPSASHSLRRWTHRKKDGMLIEVETTGNPILFQGRHARLILATDVTARASLEAQLVQAQKMDSIGRLAGGIAHDFNNLLGVITGYGALLKKRIPDDPRLRKYIEEILLAADRAVGLTSQLLVFSRKQVLEPRTLNLNVVVEDVEKMLRRLIGEDIQFETVFEKHLGLVKADPGQLGQVLMNLAINARDAMPRGGRLVIETANVSLDADYAHFHPGVEPGDYAMLAVTDTGQGMTPEIQAHIFEPFFTTKEAGKGTGLGLATVHGIVKQSGGHIWLYSEPGHGTTFKIYLPRIEGADAIDERAAVPAEIKRGSETVLLVEDDAPLRELVRECLTENGYTVLEAGKADEAEQLFDRHPIHLLVTDVVMPMASGPALAERLRSLRSGLKVLYMSGYTDDAMARHGALDEGSAFLQKPFTAEALMRKVRDVLDGR
jgi:two-component system cell cycle sensor histidine kinase/response regulator CckA